MFHTCTQIFFTPDNIFFLNWMKSADQPQLDEVWLIFVFFFRFFFNKWILNPTSIFLIISSHLAEKSQVGALWKSAKVVEKL